MMAVDLSNDVIIPSGVAIVGAMVAGISAVLKSWFENKDARSRGDRKLDLAKRRTEFAKEWIEISTGLDDGDSQADLVQRARRELEQAGDETETAFYEASADTSTGLRQLRRLVMLVRRRSLASYVVSGLFLYVSVFVWLLVCIPTPGDDGFSIPLAIFVSIVTTFVLRVLAGALVGALERHAISDTEKIAGVQVKGDEVTITTKAEHGFSADNKHTVLVDANYDEFDGEHEITPTTKNAFTFKLTAKVGAADAKSLPNVTGWVCGDSFKQQMKRLFLNPEDRRRGGRAIAGLFLVSVVLISVAAVEASRRHDTGQHQVCIGEPYDGTYFGADDYLGDEVLNGIGPTLENGELDGYPRSAKVFLEEIAPPWSTKYLTFTIEESRPNEENTFFESDYLSEEPAGTEYPWESWTLVDSNRDRYTLDAFGLRYENKRTVLYRRSGDSGLKRIGDPCAPQRLTVTVTDAPILAFDEETEQFVPGVYDEATDTPIPGEWDDSEWNLWYSRLFEFYDDLSNTGSSIISLPANNDLGTRKQIDAYFGRDGRLIPVCNDTKSAEIYPCLERGDAYYDSGLDDAVTQVFLVGLAILLGSIVSRVIFGWIADRFDRASAKDPEPAAPAI